MIVQKRSHQQIVLINICNTLVHTCNNSTFGSREIQHHIMSRNRSRSPRRQTSWGPSWEEVVEPSWEELSWIDEQNSAVVPKECTIDMPLNVLTHERWSTNLIDFMEHDSEEEHESCNCGHWQCPCCAHLLFSEQELVDAAHEDAAHEAMVDEVHFWASWTWMSLDESWLHDRAMDEQLSLDESCLHE